MAMCDDAVRGQENAFSAKEIARGSFAHSQGLPRASALRPMERDLEKLWLKGWDAAEANQGGFTAAEIDAGLKATMAMEARTHEQDRTLQWSEVHDPGSWEHIKLSDRDELVSLRAENKRLRRLERAIMAALAEDGS